jgi:hypothetical protein
LSVRKKDEFLLILYATARIDDADGLRSLLSSVSDIVPIVDGIERVEIVGRLSESSFGFRCLISFELFAAVICCCA